MTISPNPVVSLLAIPGRYSVHRLDAQDLLSDDVWKLASEASLFSVTRTLSEISIVAPEGSKVPGVVETPWTAWQIEGPIPFGLTGVVASVVTPLANAGCPVFVLSTFDGDVLMVPAGNIALAQATLSAAGHRVGGF